ncbi:MAG: DNA mismatch repair endonuclease MutL [Vicinamibacteria bacterium]
MPRIARLSDDLVNKIAAGEVVERPASVVKELVENALDAGARSVVVEIEAGGKTLVRVRDDGAGMGREDAALSVERHATSKISRLEDLHAVATHGFRGEALASIASVGQLLLRTREQDEAEGSEVEVRHGRVLGVRAAGHPRGTTVELRDLFGGVPARRKFLRADATEAGHVAEAVTLLALARPQIGFRLTSDARTLIDAPPVAERAERVYQLFGADALERMAAVDWQEGYVGVSGFVSRPDARGPARPLLRIFVNGRPVRDRALGKAAAEAYRAAGVRDPRAEGCLFVELPAHLVDVNVHPAKTEVRFADGRAAFHAVEKAVRAALSGSARAPVAGAGHSFVAEEPPVDVGGRGQPEQEALRWSRGPDAGSVRAAREAIEPEAHPVAGTWDEAQPTSARGGEPLVLGQHRLVYIVATDGDELLLVDQHTAHERVRFEALLAGSQRHEVPAQRLLAPSVLPLSPRLLALVDAQREHLAALGFDVEFFGGGSLRLGSVPAILGTRDPGPALEAILRDLLEREASEWAVLSARERLVATLACHSAVRAGQALSLPSMTAIVRELEETEHPGLCPHGRPTRVRIPRDDLARWFGRVGWRRR